MVTIIGFQRECNDDDDDDDDDEEEEGEEVMNQEYGI